MDIFQTVTDRIVAELENGCIPWRKPWQGSALAVSHTTGKPYSLLNQMLLGRAGEYLTFAQVKQENGYVRKGEKSSIIVFWKFIEKDDEETGETVQIPYLRYYSVFHIDQCEGIRAKYTKELTETANADEIAEAIITDYTARESVTIEHEQGNRAYYQPATDKVWIIGRIHLPLLRRHLILTRKSQVSMVSITRISLRQYIQLTFL